MKIAFTGAHSTGKTTLTSVLSEDLKLPLIDNLAGKLWSMITLTEPESNLRFATINPDRVGRDCLISYQDAILKAYEFAENYYYGMEKGFITSRSVYDHYAYRKRIPSDEQLYIQGVGRCDGDCYDPNYLHERMMNYDFIFYTPIEFETDKKGFDESRREVDAILQECFYHDPILSNGIVGKLHEIRGSVDQRLEAVIRILSEWEK